MKIWIARHGETDRNKKGVWQGYEGSLTENGREQAERLGKFIKMAGIGAIYASDMPRAVNTAEIIGEITKIHAIKKDPLLRERGIGVIEGLRYEEIPLKLSMPNMTITSRLLDLVDGSEKLDYFRSRVARAMLVAGDTDDDKLLVSHGGVMALILNLFGYEINVKNCDAILLNKADETYRLEKYYVNSVDTVVDITATPETKPYYFL